VSAVTDADGRYVFCGVSPGPGFVSAGDCNDARVVVTVEIRRGDNVRDVDITESTNCP
jgi:hypothetical protein